MNTTTLQSSYVFLSYSRAEEADAKRLEQDLGAYGLPVWRDEASINPGSPDWETAIRDAISHAYAVVVIASPYVIKSLYVKGELDLAKRFHPNCIYPVWMKGVEWSDCVPIDFINAEYIDMRGEKYTRGLNELVSVLKKAKELYSYPQKATAVHQQGTLLPLPIYAHPQSSQQGFPFSSSSQQVLKPLLSQQSYQGTTQYIQRQLHPHHPMRMLFKAALISGLCALVVVTIITYIVLLLGAKVSQPSPVVNPAAPVSSPKSNPTPTSTPLANNSLIHQGPDQEYTTSWSPDGTKIAAAGNDDIIQVWDPVTGNSLFNLNSGSSKVLSVAWSPDGTKIASGQQDGTVQIWDAKNGSHISQLTGHSGQVNAVSWSSDSRYIVSGSGDKTARVWNVANGKTITIYRGHSSWINSVAWSHNSPYIVSGGGDKTAQVWDAFSGSNILTYSLHANEVLTVAWSPDNSRIASASDDGTVQIWDSMNGNRYVNYTGHASFVVAIAWSPDGQYIASGGVDTTVQVWKAIDGTPISTYTGHSAEVEGVTWSPDSKRVASASDDKTVQIWQVPF
jgi:hypothetical protein